MTTHSAQKVVPSLSEVYKDDFKVGAAVNPITLHSQKELIIKHFNSLTAENEMKFESLQPEEGTFTFDKADQLLSFANENHKSVRGHTLVWHNQTPDWVFKTKKGTIADRYTLLERMNTHISTVMERYKGQIYSWDVVNEAVADTGVSLLRDSKWKDIVGEDFIDKAFEYAHLADPNAALFYNDYNESHPEKREKIYSLTKSLVEKGVPIHGIGLQAHWNIYSPSLDHIRVAIERYASLGLQIHITEMDVSVYDVDDKRTDVKVPTQEMIIKQTERYNSFFELFREYSDVITSVTFWGAADDYTWLDDFPVRGRKNWPLLFDEHHQPKQSFWQVINR
ncbi:endo-1,4-beta-xylanase [Metabacillus niabensis]|uniref:Beta-xylanase n=2 Tax=Metabacillus niabensis TaxID=324854 RepID=A0ABT9Z1P5_9BACI|nr:endo-1,4-beta-xylanase [Metabacillus niabensis]MDQ0226169.1 endo-1,4-beta-xylanase [Metabacillus niabensis]